MIISPIKCLIPFFGAYTEQQYLTQLKEDFNNAFNDESRIEVLHLARKITLYVMGRQLIDLIGFSYCFRESTLEILVSLLPPSVYLKVIIQTSVLFISLYLMYKILCTAKKTVSFLHYTEIFLYRENLPYQAINPWIP